jgi:hypothetical protein
MFCKRPVKGVLSSGRGCGKMISSTEEVIAHAGDATQVPA